MIYKYVDFACVSVFMFLNRRRIREKEREREKKRAREIASDIEVGFISRYR